MKKATKFIIMLVFVFLAFALSSCESTSKEATAAVNPNINVSCYYNSSKDTTSVEVSVIVKNNSIYNIDKCSFKFNIFNNDELVRTTDYSDFNLKVKHGREKKATLSFEAAGEVTNVDIQSWSAHYVSFWSTYNVIIIITIIVAVAISIIALFIIIFSGMDTLVELIMDNVSWGLTLLVPFVIYVVYGGIDRFWSWVIFVIIAIGIVAAIVLLGLLILIGYIIFAIIDYVGTFSCGSNYYINTNYVKNNASNDDEYVSIEECLDDQDMLMQFSVADLREYCKKNNYNGYGQLNKKELVTLIMNKGKYKKTEVIDQNTNSKSTKAKKITFDDIAGLNEAKEAFREKVILPFEHPELFEKFGKRAGGGILLYGLPGTGKTMFAEAASNELDALFISVKCSDIKSKWYGESEANIKKIFDTARSYSKAIIFFDEFEAIGSKRTDNSENANNDLVPEILAEMQGVGTNNSNSTIMVIAATNKPWAIDSAFLRPGRFDEKIYIPLPDAEARKKMFELELSKLPTEDLDYDYLVKITEGFNGADIKEVCEKLKMSAIKDSITKGSNQTIGMDDVGRIESSIKSSVSQEDIDALNEFKKSNK